MKSPIRVRVSAEDGRFACQDVLLMTTPSVSSSARDPRLCLPGLLHFP